MKIKINKSALIFMFLILVSLGSILYFSITKSYCSNQSLKDITGPDRYKKIKTCANLRVPRAMGLLGKLYMCGEGVKQDYVQSMSWSSKAAEKNDIIGLENIGRLYNNGLGVKQDYSKAIYWFQRAVDNGSVDAMLNLSRSYANNSLFNNVPTDKIKALEWLKKGAESGSMQAMFNLGLEYEWGNTYVEQDFTKAREWYEKGAELGDTRAFISLGILLHLV